LHQTSRFGIVHYESLDGTGENSQMLIIVFKPKCQLNCKWKRKSQIANRKSQIANANKQTAEKRRLKMKKEAEVDAVWTTD
jgi:hypothetical protein